MRTNLVPRPVAIALLTLVPAAALGVGYSAPNVNPADLAMAGSRVAAQDGAAAVFANASALPRFQGLNVSLAWAAIDFGSTWTDPGGTQAPSTSSTKTDYAVPPAVYASYGFRLPNGMAAAVGAGVAIPFGGNLYWPEDWPGRFEIVNVDRRIYGTYLMAALEPLSWLRIGSGLIWYHGTEKLARAMNSGASEGSAQLATSGDGFSFGVSTEIEPSDRFRIGVDYKHQAVMSLDGHVHFTGAPPELGLVDQDVKHQATMPNTLDVGVSYRVLPALLATAAFAWERYVVFDQDAFAGSAGLSIVLPRKYHNGYNYRLGVEGGPFGNLKVRAGVERGVAPTPASWMHPSIPDADLWAGSVGLAYAVGRRFEIGASYQHAWFDETRSCQQAAGQCSPNNVFPAIQDTHANVLSLGATWRWAGGH